MSYYKNITDWVLTHHAKRRIKERIDVSHLKDYEIYPYIEELIKYSIQEKCSNGEIKFINYEHNITLVTKNNIIKTVINHKKKY